MRTLRDKRGVTGFQTLSRAMDRLLPLIAFAISEVNVPIDQPRQHGCLAQVDDLGACRNLDTSRRSDVGNAVTPDEHHLIVHVDPRLGIENLAGSNGNNLQTLWSLGPHSSPRRRPQQDGETNDWYKRNLQTHDALLFILFVFEKRFQLLAQLRRIFVSVLVDGVTDRHSQDFFLCSGNRQ